MSIAVAQPRHIFGLKVDVSSNVHYQDEHTVVYPAGAYCVIYNLDTKQQKFIAGSEKCLGFTAMAVAPNRRYVALAERTAERPAVAIYDLTTLKKKKMLSCADIMAQEFVSITFSPDSKYLLAQSGSPDWVLVFWTWEKARLMAQTKTALQQVATMIGQCAFNPHDNTQVSIAGEAVFRIYRYTEGQLKPHYSQRAEGRTYTSHCWLGNDLIVCGTDNGRLHIFEDGEMKLELEVLDPAHKEKLLSEKRMPSLLQLGPSALDNYSTTSSAAPPQTQQKTTIALETPSSDLAAFSSKFSPLSVYALVPTSKGFICACGAARAHVFDRDEKVMFKKVKEFIVRPRDTGTSEVARLETEILASLTVSPSEENVIATSNLHQMYIASMSSTDWTKGSDIGYFEVLGQTFHNRNVTGVDVCIRKPLVATCSTDKTIRVWNYDSCSLEIYKEFAEEAYSVALHPSGLYLLVGFSDKLKLMNILIDDIRTFKEFPIRSCSECLFSNGGHMFAVVQNNLIQIYSSMTFEVLKNLQGHNGKVKAVSWASDDTRLMSCGADGAVYEWDVFQGRRSNECILRTCSYSGVAVAPDNKTTYGVGTDRKLKEIAESNVNREVDLGDMMPTQVAMSHSGKMLFTSSMTGFLRCVKFPLSMSGDWQDHVAHTAQITKMKVTTDDRCLITVSEDSTVLIWKVQDREGRGRERETAWAEEILVTKADLEEKNQSIQELKLRVHELEKENEYQLRLKDMNYNEKIKELTEKFIQEMEALKTKNQVLKIDKEKGDAKHEEEISDVVGKHEKELQDLEAANNQKLTLEYSRYEELQKKTQKMQEEYEREKMELEESKESALEELTEQYETRLKKMQLELEQVRDELRQQSKEHEETKGQIEEDADREILDLKTKYERRLKEEREQNSRLKGETGIMRKKFQSQQKDIDDLKEEINKYKNEEAKLNNIIKSLEKDIAGLKKEVQERDETIQDKERRIYDLKKKNQELEKFKFVLDYKIKELKKQIEPREEEIRRMKEQIQEMESELERFHKTNTQLELDIKELKLKLKSTEEEVKRERQQKQDWHTVNKRFQTDLHNTASLIQEPALLKESVRQLYTKYCTESAAENATVDADIQNEWARQREHLEKTIGSLRKKLKKDSDRHKTEYYRIMQENMTLIQEINDLRTELKMSRTRVNNLEAAMGLKRKTGPDIAALAQALQATNKTAVMELELNEKTKVVDMLTDQLRRSRIGDLAALRSSSAQASARLPPLSGPESSFDVETLAAE